MKRLNQKGSGEGSAIIVIFILICALIAAMMFGLPHYKVYRMNLSGKAAYAEAQSSRQIRVLEAQAKFESAKMEAAAEIERAKGVAQANKIIGNSLHGNEAYLRYLWIQTLENKEKSVIYVPTEANLPVLEAARLNR